jgi:hypothetical protein
MKQILNVLARGHEINKHAAAKKIFNGNMIKDYQTSLLIETTNSRAQMSPNKKHRSSTSTMHPKQRTRPMKSSIQPIITF